MPRADSKRGGFISTRWAMRCSAPEAARELPIICMESPEIICAMVMASKSGGSPSSSASAQDTIMSSAC